jgi:glycosyltransferase involved in cell wall biosynthesis
MLVNRRALGAFAIGERARRDFIRWGIDERRIRLLPYSVAALEASGIPPADRTAPVFTQVGELCHRKGVDVLLQAFALVSRRHPDARLDLIGDGAQSAEYQKLASQLQIADAVRFMGAVPAPEVAGYLQRADVLVLASRFDGWGVVLNEGASLGKALIATDATGAADHLIRDGENGFRVPAGDPTALQEALARYCEDPALAKAHGTVSSKIFQDYTPTANVERLRQGLASLLAVG